MPGCPHDGGRNRGILGHVAVNFHPDFHALPSTGIAQFPQRIRNAAHRGIYRDVFLRQSVWPHLHAPRSGIVREVDERFSNLDLTPAFGRIGGLEFAGGAEAKQPYFAALEQIFHPLPLSGVDGRLYKVLMTSPQFHRLEVRSLQIPDDGLGVPVF